MRNLFVFKRECCFVKIKLNHSTIEYYSPKPQHGSIGWKNTEIGDGLSHLRPILSINWEQLECLTDIKSDVTTLLIAVVFNVPEFPVWRQEDLFSRGLAGQIRRFQLRSGSVSRLNKTMMYDVTIVWWYHYQSNAMQWWLYILPPPLTSGILHDFHYFIFLFSIRIYLYILL